MILFSNEKENSEAVIAGAMARCTDATVWARPFVAPSIPLGAADEMYMKVQPEMDVEKVLSTHEEGCCVPYDIITPVKHNIWTSTRTQRTTSVPEFCAWVPLIGKRRNEGTRQEVSVMNVRRSPRDLRMGSKAVSWRVPHMIPQTAMQTPMGPGSKPSPPSRIDVVYTSGTKIRVLISRKERVPYWAMLSITGLVNRVLDRSSC